MTTLYILVFGIGVLLLFLLPALLIQKKGHSPLGWGGIVTAILCAWTARSLGISPAVLGSFIVGAAYTALLILSSPPKTSLNKNSQPATRARSICGHFPALAIVALLTWLLGSCVYRNIRINRAKDQMLELMAKLSFTLDTEKMKNACVSRSEMLAAIAPLLKRSAGDPWGNPFVLSITRWECRDAQLHYSYELRCYGCDSTPNTKDDIVFIVEGIIHYSQGGRR